MGSLPSRRRSPIIAAALSFVLPGLGQAFAGRLRRAALVAVPALIAAAYVGWLVLRGHRTLADLLLSPDLLLAVLFANAAALVYHAWAIVDAYLVAGHGRPAARPVVTRVAIAILLTATVGVHGAFGWLDSAQSDFLVSFTDPHGPSWMATIPDFSQPPSTSPTVASSTSSGLATASPDATSSPSPTLSPTPLPTLASDWARSGRLDMLLIGADSGPDRWMLRTDTMILVSVDLKTGKAAMFGIPRNIVNVPLPPETAGAFACRCYPDMLNSLYVYAAQHPWLFPGGDLRGFKAVEGAVSALTGVKVDGAVVVNLAGFVKLIDSLGGLTMNVTERVVDDHYPLEDASGSIKIDIEPGVHHFNGRMALAYARSRHQDDDYNRMRRQQQTLLALRQQITPCTLAPRVPSILSALKDTFWTDIPITSASDLLALAQRVDPARVATVTFVPPTYPEYLNPAAIGAIRTVVAGAFTTGPSQASPGPTSGSSGTSEAGGGGFSC